MMWEKMKKQRRGKRKERGNVEGNQRQSARQLAMVVLLCSFCLEHRFPRSRFLVSSPVVFDECVYVRSIHVAC